MPELTVDNKKVSVAEGATVLDACQHLGIDVPTMCHLPGHGHFTSCMVCVVKNVGDDGLMPACSARAVDGMTIETTGQDVTDARRASVELLLSEHVGDCEGPCERVCPAGINIPVIIRRLAAGDRDGARALLHAVSTGDEIPCEVCRGPCESPCRRKQIDEAVGIRSLMLFAAGRHARADERLERSVPRRFNSIVGRLSEAECECFLSQASPQARVEPADAAVGYTPEEAVAEAGRCLHCDCRKPETCRLRCFAEELGCRPARFRAEERAEYDVVVQHPDVIYEPGKCIKCGICVRLTEESHEPLGMTFLGRGYGVRVGAPFNASLSGALTDSALACVKACPTGALALRDAEERCVPSKDVEGEQE